MLPGLQLDFVPCGASSQDCDSRGTVNSNLLPILLTSLLLVPLMGQAQIAYCNRRGVAVSWDGPITCPSCVDIQYLQLSWQSLQTGDKNGDTAGALFSLRVGEV